MTWRCRVEKIRRVLLASSRSSQERPMTIFGISRAKSAPRCGAPSGRGEKVPDMVEFMPTEPQAATNDLDHAASVFASVRPRLFGIAYRMLGSSAEAEDIVQDVWLRWQAYDRST